jgi:hypothetical protein
MSLTVNDLPLEEKLKTEQRVCPECKYIVQNPFIEICPRCSAKLPHLNLDCQGCVHRILCPTEKSRKLTRQ